MRRIEGRKTEHVKTVNSILADAICASVIIRIAHMVVTYTVSNTAPKLRWKVNLENVSPATLADTVCGIVILTLL